MPLFKHIRDDVARYEDITRTKFSNAIFYMYYMVDDVEKHKKLPYRATKEQLQSAIEAIRLEIGYYGRREKRIASGQFKVGSRRPAFFVPE